MEVPHGYHQVCLHTYHNGHKTDSKNLCSCLLRLYLPYNTGTSLNYTWEDPSKPHEVQWWPAKQEKVKTTATVSFDADGTVSFPFGLDMSMVGGSDDVEHEDFDDVSSEASILMSSAKSKTSTVVIVYLFYF